MNGTLARLPQVDLVQIGLQDLGFVVMEIQQHRHHSFDAFSGERALTCKIEILHQLLGQRAAALTHLTGHHIGIERPGNALERNPKVLEKVTILHRQQGLQQLLRYLIQLHQHPILIMSRVDAADQRGLQPHNTGGLPGAIQITNPATAQIKTDSLGRLRPLPEIKATTDDLIAAP